MIPCYLCGCAAVALVSGVHHCGPCSEQTERIATKQGNRHITQPMIPIVPRCSSRNQATRVQCEGVPGHSGPHGGWIDLIGMDSGRVWDSWPQCTGYEQGWRGFVCDKGNPCQLHGCVVDSCRCVLEANQGVNI